jgi:hypothetical protein
MTNSFFAYFRTLSCIDYTVSSKFRRRSRVVSRLQVNLWNRAIVAYSHLQPRNLPEDMATAVNLSSAGDTSEIRNSYLLLASEKRAITQNCSVIIRSRKITGFRDVTPVFTGRCTPTFQRTLLPPSSR